MDPHAPDHVIVDMIKFADADADSKVDFGEFKKICSSPATTTPRRRRIRRAATAVGRRGGVGADERGGQGGSDGGDTPTRVGYRARAGDG